MRLKTIEAACACVLLIAVSLTQFQTRAAGAQEKNQSDFTFSVRYTSSSFAIYSASSKGNFSFVFEWENTNTFVEWNGTSRMIKELKQVAFTDETVRYRMEYWMPRLFYEYLDADNNGLFTGASNVNWALPGPDIYVMGYKINTNIDMTDVTQVQKEDETTMFEWTYTQLAMPMESNIQGPLEQLSTVKEVFHYNPHNGTLKMDIILENFKPRNDASRVYLSYAVQYIHLLPGNTSLAVVVDNQERQLSQFSKAYPANSSLIAFRADGTERAFFDFGGTITIDKNSNVQLKGSVGPPDIYWLNEANVWLAIGLNYPHVNHTLVHDPYFGLSLTGTAAFLPSWAITVATALVSFALLTAVVYNHRKTKNLFRIPRNLITAVQT